VRTLSVPAHARRRFSAGAVVATALVIVLLSAATSFAAGAYFFDSSINGNQPGLSVVGAGAQRHSITAVSARKLDYNGQQECVNALNDPNGGLAAQWTCTTAYDGLAINDHFCGCALRLPQAWNNGQSGSWIRAQYSW
jgi:hypothetical protein